MTVHIDESKATGKDVTTVLMADGGWLDEVVTGRRVS